jgi:glucose-6-phosphate 1-dehydrogenase
MKSNGLYLVERWRGISLPMKVSPTFWEISGELRTDESPSILTVVLANIFKGDQSSFVREDEVIAAWEIFTP